MEKYDGFFLRYCQTTKINQKEINNLNRFITNEESEIVMKSLTTEKVQSQRDSQAGFYQTFKNLQPGFLKLFNTKEAERVFPNSFYEASIILIEKYKKKCTGQVL